LYYDILYLYYCNAGAQGNFPIKAAIGNSHWSVVEAFLSHYKEHPPAADSKVSTLKACISFYRLAGIALHILKDCWIVAACKALPRVLKGSPVDLTLLCLHAYIHLQACLLQECNFEKVLCSAMLEGESHIVHRFLSCTGLSRDLDLVRCHCSATICIIAESWKLTLPLSFCIVMLTAQTLNSLDTI